MDSKLFGVSEGERLLVKEYLDTEEGKSNKEELIRLDAEVQKKLSAVTNSSKNMMSIKCDRAHPSFLDFQKEYQKNMREYQIISNELKNYISELSSKRKT